MSIPARRRVSFEEYVRLEDYSNVRHEYFEGAMYAMAGGTPRHAALTSRVIVALGAQLRGGSCEVFDPDLRIRVAATGLATYPDVSVVCGPLETDPADPNTVLNPVVLVEVLSDSTEEYDRGEKLEQYRQIPTVRDVVLASHREPVIELWSRREGGWVQRTCGAGARAELVSIGCTLDVDELYRNLP